MELLLFLSEPLDSQPILGTRLVLEYLAIAQNITGEHSPRLARRSSLADKSRQTLQQTNETLDL